jgi:hypothetical protein
MVELWQSVSRAVHHSDELWDRKHEVDQLRDEEQHHGFAKVAQYPHDCEGHSRTVAESVSDEDFGRESVVLK